MTAAQRNAIQNPTIGLQVWCSDCGLNGQFQIYNGINWTNAISKVIVGSYPSIPLNPFAIQIGNYDAEISFNPPMTNGGNTIEGYIINANIGNIMATGISSPISISGLIPGNTYFFNVVAINSNGPSIAATSNSLSLNSDLNWDVNGNKNIKSNYFLGNKNAQAFSARTNQSKQFEIGLDGSIDFQNNFLNNFCIGVENKTGSYTLREEDIGKILTFNSSNPIMLTIPAGLPVGFHVSILQTGIGQIDFVASSGVVLNNVNNVFSTVDTYSTASIMSYANNALLLSGDLD